MFQLQLINTMSKIQTILDKLKSIKNFNKKDVFDKHIILTDAEMSIKIINHQERINSHLIETIVCLFPADEYQYYFVQREKELFLYINHTNAIIDDNPFIIIKNKDKVQS